MPRPTQPDTVHAKHHRRGSGCCRRDRRLHHARDRQAIERDSVFALHTYFGSIRDRRTHAHPRDVVDLCPPPTGRVERTDQRVGVGPIAELRSSTGASSRCS